MGEQKFEIGLIGLGEMGRNLALNIADHGIPIAVCNRTAEKTKEFISTEGAEWPIGVGYSRSEFIGRLRKPLYLGLGISGGGSGARFGPSLMPGGLRKPMNGCVRSSRPSPPR